MTGPSGFAPRESQRDSPSTTASESPSGAALAGVRASYATWLGLDTEGVIHDRGEDPDEIRALQIVLRMERGRPPSWHTALALAARGCAALCLDPRAEPGGDWYDAVRAYAAGHIRKVTRRARAGHWDAVADLPGITLADGDTEIRVLVPGRVVELDKRVSRLQVGGTDTPRIAPETWPPAGPGALVIHLSPTVAMTLGKSMAQAGHAGMIAAALLAGDDRRALHQWYDRRLPVAARPVERDTWDRLARRLGDPARAWQTDRLLAVRDAGFTEIGPGTITVIAEAPQVV